MPIDFPDSPTPDEVFTSGSRSWKWVGSVWRAITGTGANNLDDLFDVDTTGKTSGDFLKYDGTGWVADSIPAINTLDDVGDVTITSVAAGDFLQWDGTAWINESSPTYVQFDTSVGSPASTEGKLQWDSDFGTLSFGLEGNNSVQQIGINQFAYCYNAEATTLNKGEVVYIFGGKGSQVSIKRALNTSDETSARTLGLVSESIASGASGYVCTYGVLAGINTSTYTEGQILYLGATAGQLTTTKPAAPNHYVFVGVVIKAGVGGEIWLRPQNGYELDELHDVSLPSPSAGQYLKYDGSLWVADTIDLGTDTTGNYVADVTAGTGVTVTHTPGEGSSPTIAIGQAVGTENDVQFNKVTVSQTLTSLGDLQLNSSERESESGFINASFYGVYVQPGNTSAEFAATGQGVYIRGGYASSPVGGAELTGGPLYIYGGDAGSGANSTGGNAYIDGGYGISLNGNVLIGTASTNNVTIGQEGKTTNIAGNLQVAGNFTVNGTTTTLNTETLAIEDNIIVLNSGVTGAPTLNAGIEVERGDSDNVLVRWNESNDKWEITNDGTNYGNIITSADTGTVTSAMIADGTITTTDLAAALQQLLVPTGSVSAFAGSAAPTGWLSCDGSVVSRTTYAALFSVIGTTYGAGDGSTTFALPNMKGRIPVGQDSGQTEFDVLGETGGAKTHTLSTAEMPSHTHTQNAHNHGVSDPGHNHSVPANWGGAYNAVGVQLDPTTYASPYYYNVTTSNGTGISINNATATNQNTGGGGAHNNLQPYIVLNYIIKA